MSSTEVMSNIKNLCYCCQENSSFTLLWKADGSNNVPYGQILQHCFCLQLDMSDTDVICPECIRDLQAAVEFRNKVAENRSKFQNVEQNLDAKWPEFKFDVNVKQETNDNDDVDNSAGEPEVIVEEQKNPSKQPKLLIIPEDFTKKADDTYSCNKCEKTSEYQQIIEHLNHTHYSSCEICKKIFRTTEEVKKHKKVHKSLICEQCDIEFTSDIKFKEHKNGSCNILVSLRNLGVLKKPELKEESTYCCSVCSKCFAKKRALMMHQMVHKPKKPKENKKIEQKKIEQKKIIEVAPPPEPKVKKVKYKVLPGDYTKDGKIYTCTKCQKTANDYSIIVRHINNIHYQHSAYNCTYCPEAFYSLYKLNSHKYNIHNDSESRFLCTACGRAFFTLTSLNSHSKSFHMLGDLLKCPECDYETYLKQGMRHHMFKHNKKVKYFCSFCPKTFTRQDSHKYHERIHTGDKRKVCPVCGEKYVQRTSLKYHIMKHHPNANVPNNKDVYLH